MINCNLRGTNFISNGIKRVKLISWKTQLLYLNSSFIFKENLFYLKLSKEMQVIGEMQSLRKCHARRGEDTMAADKKLI